MRPESGPESTASALSSIREWGHETRAPVAKRVLGEPSGETKRSRWSTREPCGETTGEAVPRGWPS